MSGSAAPAPAVRPRHDTELLEKGVYRVAVARERVRLPAAAIEREHELGAKSFAVRVVGDEQLELRNELGRIAYCQLCLDALFERLQPT